MTPAEANVLLTQAALLNVAGTPDAMRARAWADALDDVDLEDALGALRVFVRSSDARWVTPRDIFLGARERKRIRRIESAPSVVETEPMNATERANVRKILEGAFGKDTPVLK